MTTKLVIRQLNVSGTGQWGYDLRLVNPHKSLFLGSATAEGQREDTPKFVSLDPKQEHPFKTTILFSGSASEENISRHLVSGVDGLVYQTIRNLAEEYSNGGEIPINDLTKFAEQNSKDPFQLFFEFF